ncbi:MAG: hypothetical protein IJX85_11020 [Lachnospiraceae bacterium]|nr:hypothetical protein [Lachnospiraceae bacterium]
MKKWINIILCILAVVSSLVIPDLLLDMNAQDITNEIVVAPEEYYIESGNAMARSTSSNLTSLEQVKLISGAWESTGTACDIDQGFLTENEAVTLARYSLNRYYDTGVFPYSEIANYNNWCSWDAKLYCYTDNLFNTYSAYMWVITFNRFDGTATHTIHMTENGVILNAQTTEADYNASNIIAAYTNQSTGIMLGDEKITVLEKSKAPEHTAIKAVYPETDYSNVSFDEIYTIELVSPEGTVESYYIYQYSNQDCYGIGLCPTTYAP